MYCLVHKYKRHLCLLLIISMTFLGMWSVYTQSDSFFSYSNHEVQDTIRSGNLNANTHQILYTKSLRQSTYLITRNENLKSTQNIIRFSDRHSSTRSGQGIIYSLFLLCCLLHLTKPTNSYLISLINPTIFCSSIIVNYIHKKDGEKNILALTY